MNAYLENSDYPFEAIFQDAISQVKEEISDRKNQARVKQGIISSKSNQSLKTLSHNYRSEHQKSQDTLDKELNMNSHGRDLHAPEAIRPQHFTEPDKRRLMSIFLQSEDILYFTYSLLYP
jgi:hypothetical protein